MTEKEIVQLIVTTLAKKGLTARGVDREDNTLIVRIIKPVTNEIVGSVSFPVKLTEESEQNVREQIESRCAEAANAAIKHPIFRK